jgi:hypothetical protein
VPFEFDVADMMEGGLKVPTFCTDGWKRLLEACMPFTSKNNLWYSVDMI